MHFARRRGTSLRSQPRQKIKPDLLPLHPPAKIIAMPNPPRERKRARELAAEFVAQGNPTGWFAAHGATSACSAAIYRKAESAAAVVPWAELAPNPHLLDFWRDRPQKIANS